MSEIFKYKYQLLPADYSKFLKIYKKDNPKIVIKYDKGDQIYYAFFKGNKDLEWKYDRDEYKLYIDEPIKNFFFKKFMEKKEESMKLNREKLQELAQDIMNDGCTKKKTKRHEEREWETLPVKERFALLSKIIFDNKDVTNLGNEVITLTEKISEQIIAESDGDWFDKHTLKRNANEITKKGKEFHKNASQLKSIFERLQALYEEIGMLIERYM